MSTRLHDWLRLSLVDGVGPATLLGLLRIWPSAGQVLDAGRHALEAHVDPGVARAIAEDRGRPAADAALAWADAGPSRFLLTLLDDDYPELLAQSPSPPPLLFGQGRRALLTRPAVAIVGSRHASPQGLLDAGAFAGDLAAHGYTIVSGLAAGIDTAAHEGALAEEASTIAVIGTGIDRVYPAGNRPLAHRIAKHGLILSEFPLGTPPAAGNFPRRNRIIAGLARACLVVEAGIASGSLITARLALEAGRDVLAIPGSIHQPQSRGCHRLIRDGARLVETLDDILDETGRLPVADTPPA